MAVTRIRGKAWVVVVAAAIVAGAIVARPSAAGSPARQPRRGAEQGTLSLKIGTIAPEGSKWHEILLDIGQKWRVASNNRIRVTTHTGSTLGDEADLIRKVRLKQLQVVMVTSVGLETISKDCAAMSIPLLFESWDEVDYVLARIQPRLEKSLEAKGFKVLNWGDAGWVRFFTVRPTPTLAEFRKLSLFTWAGDPHTEELYKDAGFKPVPLTPNDVLQSLQTHTIDAFPSPAIGALAFQWFGLAKNMIDLKFAPIVGATIISNDVWNGIEPGLRDVLAKEAKASGERMKAEIRTFDDQAIEEMKKRGLKVITLTDAQQREWKQLAEKFYPRIRGEVVQPADFDEVRKLVDEYRAKNAKKK